MPVLLLLLLLWSVLIVAHRDMQRKMDAFQRKRRPYTTLMEAVQKKIDDGETCHGSMRSAPVGWAQSTGPWAVSPGAPFCTR